MDWSMSSKGRAALHLCNSAALRRLCNSPIGTKGFSLVFLINFSLNVSSLCLGSGLKPSMMGGCDRSNATGPCGGAAGVWSGAAAVAIATLGKDTRGRDQKKLHFRERCFRFKFRPRLQNKSLLNIMKRKLGVSVTFACPPGVRPLLCKHCTR